MRAKLRKTLTVLKALSHEDQVALVEGLTKHLVNQGYVGEEALSCFASIATAAAEATAAASASIAARR